MTSLSRTCGYEGCTTELTSRHKGTLCTKHGRVQWRVNNRERVRKQDRERHAAKKRTEPVKFRNSFLKTRYGITVDKYLEMFESQGGHCAICPTTADPENNEWLHVDHDHSCCDGIKSCGKCVRGLLCGPCNRGLGCLGDSPEKLEEAARYLRTASTRD